MSKTAGDTQRITRASLQPSTKPTMDCTSPPRVNPTQTVSSPSTEPTLAAIMNRLSKLDEIDSKLAKLETIEASLADLKASTESFVKKTTTDLDVMAARLAESDRQHVASDRRHLIDEYRIEQMEINTKHLKMQINDLENKSRICNLKIEGKYEDPQEDLKAFILDMASHLVPTGLNPAAIVSIHRIGKLQPPQTKPGQRHPRPRIILLTMRSVQERNELFFARTKLRGTNAFKQIYLNDDTTLQTRKLREDYRSVAALAQANGSNVKVHGDGIIIDGRKFKHGEADQLPNNLSLANAKTIQMDGGIYFCSEHSYMSNFFPAPFVDQGIIYPTAEHKIQSLKCEAAGDQAKLEKVRIATSPLEAKRIGDTITETAQWRNGRDDMLKTIIDLKFDQHPHLATLLKSTGDMTLHEATTNTYYGIGATLHSRELRDRSYSGRNKLGMALQSKRDNLRKADTALSQDSR